MSHAPQQPRVDHPLTLTLTGQRATAIRSEATLRQEARLFLERWLEQPDRMDDDPSQTLTVWVDGLDADGEEANAAGTPAR